MATRGPDPTVTDEELIQAIREHEDPFATAGDVADTVGLSGERVRIRLNRLADAGEVDRSKVGGRAVIYWLPSSGG